MDGGVCAFSLITAPAPLLSPPTRGCPTDSMHIICYICLDPLVCVCVCDVVFGLFVCAGADLIKIFVSFCALVHWAKTVLSLGVDVVIIVLGQQPKKKTGPHSRVNKPV